MKSCFLACQARSAPFKLLSRRLIKITPRAANPCGCHSTFSWSNFTEKSFVVNPKKSSVTSNIYYITQICSYVFKRLISVQDSFRTKKAKQHNCPRPSLSKFFSGHFSLFEEKVWSEMMNEMTPSNPSRFREKLLSQAIFHLCKKLKLSSHQLNSKNNGPVSLFKTIFMYWHCFLQRMAKMEMDWNLEKLGQLFQVLMQQLYLQKSPKYYNGSCYLMKYI